MNNGNAEAAIAVQLQMALDHHRAGRLREAEALYRQILRMAPEHADALHWLGVLAHQAGQSEAALALIDRAIGIHSSHPVYHDHRGMVLQALGKAEEAVVCHRTAIALKADYAEAHNSLGNALKTLGRLDEAAESYRAALSLKPDFAEAHNNLGTVFHEQGKLAEAVASYRNTLSLKPNDATSHYNLGNAQRDLGKPDAAIDCYRRAISFRPNYTEAHNNLGNAQSATGRFDAALVSYEHALELKETPEFKSNFVRCLQSAEFTEVDAGVRRMVIRAVSEPWARPADLAAACIRLLARDGAIRACIDRAASAWPTRLSRQELFGPAGISVLSDDALLRALLENAQVCDLAMERLLTMVRHAVLDAATDGVGRDVEGGVLTFCCALARQCFINDFVFSCTETELDRATLLKERLAAELARGNAVRASWIAAVAAYFPLLSVPGAEALPAGSWPESIAALLKQQIAEPLAEQRYRDHLPRLTPIDDDVSHSVRQQYEEHPYPRWIRLPPPAPARGINAHLARLFPFASFHPIDETGGVDILVAGCGTGQESIETAQDFPTARVLAVDLSLASLGYAERKATELRVANVEHAQADLMKLGSIGRTFAVITSVGVLHHLADPMAGLRELLSLLRPGGFLLLGLYSERARRSIVAARAFIAERGYRPTAADIRQCRQDLMMSAGDGAPFGELASIRDFYVTGECRDLLFHVQEHRFVLPQIKALLAALGLRLIGFLLAPHVAKSYAERFPEDRAMTDLDRWNAFEAEYPDTFAGMYVFWAQLC
jgi:tetratricopeptide (TPR) repeat protein/SAM-dependent methyltransferase